MSNLAITQPAPANDWPAITASIEAYQPTADDDTAAKARALEFLQTPATQRPPFLRLTGLAIVINGRSEFAVVYNKYVQRDVMPGGKIKASDRTLADTAARELLEETGVQVGAPISAVPFNIAYFPQVVFAHSPPDRFIDVQFLFRAPAGAELQALDGVKNPRWLAMPQLRAALSIEPSDQVLLKKLESLV